MIDQITIYLFLSINCRVQLLRQRKPNAPQEWLNKLPQMAKRFEESLYRSAPSFEAYNDISTLKQRLQQLAMNIGMKTKQMQLTQQQQTQQVGVVAASQQHQQGGGQLLAQPTGQPQYQQQQQMQPPPQQQARQQPSIGAALMPPQPLQQPHLTTQQPQLPQQQQRQLVNGSDINPNITNNQQRAPAVSQANYAVPPDGGIAPAPPQQPQPMGAPPVANAAPFAAAPYAAGAAARQPSDRQQVLRH
jgi:hypothetical protein